ncbi:hypothetical protein AB0E27_24735 [Streptomyces sparsogenes]|uniref:hypothetical protein n=1 Tax=Streptomyces sparsogenes TaxID=67365 RepID=UPI003407AF3F
MTGRDNNLAAGSHASGRQATPQQVVGALFVDLEGIRARYECLRSGCTQRVEGPVHGATDVQAFVASIRTSHRCTGALR